MTKRTIELDLDTMAEEVTEVIVRKMGLDDRGKDLSKGINLEVLKFLKDEDFQTELVSRYIGKAEILFKDLGWLFEKLGVEIKND